jgi:hypothetical protein
MMAALAAVEEVALVGCRHTQCATAAAGLVPGLWRHATRCGGMRPGVVQQGLAGAQGRAAGSAASQDGGGSSWQSGACTSTVAGRQAGRQASAVRCGGLSRHAAATRHVHDPLVG